jgi:uncharacterized protein (DUF1786 family)
MNMSKVLTIDVGAGTMDVLYIDTASECYYKAVVRSPVCSTAERILTASGKMLIVGVEMGGHSIAGHQTAC